MKIICIGKNYVQHAGEMDADVPDEPLFFMKPESSLLPYGEPFVLPSFSDNIHYELEVMLRISNETSDVTVSQARQCYDGIGIGIDFTARDLQDQLKKQGRPWEKSKAFNRSAATGKRLLPKSEFQNRENLTFQLKQNGEVVQDGHTRNMVFSFEELIAYVSQFVTLHPGDLVFTGTPEGVGPVCEGDRLTGTLAGHQLIDCPIRAEDSS